MSDNQIFTIENFGKKETFSSFLPGIAGMHGIPIWCLYVNRGQAIAAFGSEDKDHAIMEFSPAHVAYRNVSTTGFRTFIRKDGDFIEPFSNPCKPTKMEIGKNTLTIREQNEREGVETKVEYFTLPGEKVGALIRKVTITNTGMYARFEVLDGMTQLIPYGIDMEAMKNMTQTAKAWMMVEDLEEKRPYFRVRASLKDTASVQEIKGGNFALGFSEDGSRLPVIVDSEMLFGYDTSLRIPVTFREEGMEVLLKEQQSTENQLPCCFFAKEQALEIGESLTIYEMIGQCSEKSILSHFLEKELNDSYFEAKREEAIALTQDMTERIKTQTGNALFDEYCRYTYMDNVLRGGLPIELGNKVFYLYSRKHGDLERDYNFFSMLPEFYSEGNGNFRDVNQNRRCDVFFAPFVGRENLHSFYGLIQMDGYNPLGVEKITYEMKEETAASYLKRIPEENRTVVQNVLTHPFTPGALYKVLDENMEGGCDDSYFMELISASDSTVNGRFIEGYWSDHWTYNLDLIEEYLSVYPEKEREMLYEDNYTYFCSQENINPRAKRYEETVNGLRQYHALDENSARDTKDKLVRTDYGRGELLTGTLFEKLILLCTVKYTALDAYGMGIEMEGGKPGWYDALNGMPGLFGSSMAESYELNRLLRYTISALTRHPGSISLFEELAELLEKLDLITQAEEKNIGKSMELMSFWNRINDAKEAYRAKTYEGVSGKHVSRSSEEIAAILEGFLKTSDKGIEKAIFYGQGLCPTYFTFEVPEYDVTDEGIIPLQFEVRTVPTFLEGPVHLLKILKTRDEKEKLYHMVKKSDLYDEKLQMYRVNSDLTEASYELGRARAFTPGWLENASIWLHMEYKYLLELLKGGLYREFFEDFQKAAVPFLDPKVYGRSTLENSSFIASSRNPNPAYHGRGFVARLSGSAIEFISMWKAMFFGNEIFTEENGELVFAPKPALPAYLIPEDHKVSTTLLGSIPMTYELSEEKDYIPGEYLIREIRVTTTGGSMETVSGGRIKGALAEEIRNGFVKEISVVL